MKGWSHHHQSSDHSDDWVDGSWTVDCICGVTYDDGDEMVDCDECGVWVHTRCSRSVKGENMFVCDKYNGGKEIRVLRDVSMGERVHVQGVPGGDRAMFDGLSAVFTPELWMSAGYVPKRFSFRYREFPWWDDENVDVRIGDGSCDRKMGSKKMKWEGEDLDVMYAQNVWLNERSLHDRNKEDVNGKKRARAADKDLEVKKKGGHTLKTVEALEDRELQSSKTGIQSINHWNLRDTVLQAPRLYGCPPGVHNNVVKPKKNLTVVEHSSETFSSEPPRDKSSTRDHAEVCFGISKKGSAADVFRDEDGLRTIKDHRKSVDSVVKASHIRRILHRSTFK